MKIFKLKYFALALIIATQWSCAVDESVQREDEANAETSGFVIDREMKYFINGALTNDYDEVKAVAKDAWHIHYDFPINKVVISTTPDEFEMYKNSNIVFKNSFIESEKAAKQKASNVPNNDVNKYVGEFKGMHNGKFDHLNHPNHLVFYFLGTNSFMMLAHKSIKELTVDVPNVHHINSAGNAVQQNFNIRGSGMLSTNKSKAYVRNTATYAKSFTMFEKKDYYGKSRTWTIPADQHLKFSGFNFIFGTNTLPLSTW